MSKLYIFGIGGTGSRVLKSLIMLLGAGVEMKNTSEIVPVIIDPDFASADLTRTIELIKRYKGIRSKIKFESSKENKFFNTDINDGILPNMIIPLKETQDKRFKEYIGLELMKDSRGKSDANYAFANLLFSEQNLESDMNVGFKGNPNIGSVVLNQITNTKEFENIIASFDQGDRIFIISSIFGGTGASGFPLLLKNLRSTSDKLAGAGIIKNAPIGAITVLPYFDVKPDNNDKSKRSQIDSSTFISKTKAALLYYDKNIKEANALYYISDDISKQYENSEGGTTQKNDAHFIEMASALAIIDFVSISPGNLITQNGVPNNCIYKEFGIKNETENIIFGNLGNQTQGLIKKELLQFTLFSKYLKEQIKLSRNTTWARDHKLDNSFFKSNFYNYDLTGFCDDYISWLNEMSSNRRGFSPFYLEEKRKDLFSLVKGLKPDKVMSLASNYDLFDFYLNEIQRDVKKDAPKETCFIELFYRATSMLVNKKFSL